jgi:hypothetical protein
MKIGTLGSSKKIFRGSICNIIALKFIFFISFSNASQPIATGVRTEISCLLFCKGNFINNILHIFVAL